jgi:thiamine pyrophosphate-dependent acetolactate synthase large subunit-like protein
MGAIAVPVAVGQTLAALGARQAFGLLGSGNFAVTNALVASGVAFASARHEGGAITMADAWARVTGEVGICTVHQGPGLTNAMTGLTEAAKSRTPLLLLAADTAAAATRSNFRIAQDQLVEAVGAIAERLRSPESAAPDTARAYRRAQTERRPVVLMLPLDVQAGTCLPPAALPSPDPQPALRPSDTAIAQVIDALARSERPLFIAGRGAALAGAGDRIAQLADRYGALLATSAVANGLFADNPWSLGISGGFASPTAARLIGEADLVIGFGVALNMWTTRHGHLLSDRATVIQVDHEADAIGAHHRVDLGVLGDVGETVDTLLTASASTERSTTGWRSPALAAAIEAGRWQHEPFTDASNGQQIDPRALSRALDTMLSAERTVAIDSGHFMGYPAMYFRVPDQHGFVFTQAFQSVGLGLASAIGAAIARPDRLTIAALGDGGALMALPEFETVARLGLRMVIVVYNDAAYGAEVHHFGPHGDALDLVRFPDTDFAALGRAAGLAGITVCAADDLATVQDWLAAEGPGALVIDAKVVPTVVAEWLEEAFRGH